MTNLGRTGSKGSRTPSNSNCILGPTELIFLPSIVIRYNPYSGLK